MAASIQTRPREAPAATVAWVLSLAVHLGLASCVVGLAFRNWAREEHEAAALRQTRDREVEVDVELAAAGRGVTVSSAHAEREGETPTPTGGDLVARVDDGERGRGGDFAASLKAIHLTDRDEALRLSPDLVSRLDRDQQQRIKSSLSRASHEDRRATTRPMEATFIASGKGERQERRDVASTDPSRGAHEALDPAVVGGELGALPSYAGELSAAPASQLAVASADRSPGNARVGGTSASPGLGVHGARPGLDHRASAAAASARPDVTQGPIAVASIDKARPRDDVDSEQEVATLVRSLVHASAAGGVAGDGRGGSGGGGDTAFGGLAGSGSHGRPLGTGAGDLFDIDTTDPRLLPYFRHVHAKIEPLWANAFPRSAIVELKQGTVIVEFVIDASGAARVIWPPLRPSGIAEFDLNCAEAIRKASPFERIPASLGVRSLRIRAPFTARSPIVN